MRRSTLVTRSIRNRRQTLGVVLGSVLVLGGLFYALKRELARRGLGTGERTIVAKLAQGTRVVQRKLDREVLWDDVDQKENLFNKDAIRTAEQSTAQIEFDDGTILELAENSLVILDRSDEKIGVQFMRGSLFASGGGKGGKSVEIQTDQGRVAVGQGDQKGALNLTSGKSGLEVTVTEGNAQLLTANGGATSIGVDEKGKLTSNGVEKQKIRIKPISPVPHAKVLLPMGEGPKGPVAFEWSLAQELKGFEGEFKLQVARDVEFVDLVSTQKLSIGAVQSKIDLPSGNYSWRILAKAKDGTVEASDGQGFQVFRTPEVRLESPEAELEKHYFKDKPTLHFVWKQLLASEIPGVHQVEFAADPGFKNKLTLAASRPVSRSIASMKDRVYESTAQLSATTGEPPTFYWRVMSRYDGIGPDGKSTLERTSEVRKISLSQSSQLAAPKLVEPTPRSIIGLSGSQTKVGFRWEPNSDAQSYLLRVATDAGFNRIVLEKWVIAPAYEAEIPATGAMYWTVIALNQTPPPNSGADAVRTPTPQDSPPAAVRSFGLTRSDGFRLTAPEKGKVFEYLKKVPEVEFKWERRGGAKEYEVQFASEPKFKDILVSKTVSANVGADPILKTDDVPKGDNFWRVRALGPNGELLSLSESGKLAIREAALLDAPELVLPAPDFKIPEDPVPKVKFEWKPPKGVDASQISEYAFELYKETSGKKWELEWSKDTDALFVERKLDGGAYRWSVRAIDQASRKGKAGLDRMILVRSPDKLPPPELAGPGPDLLIKKRDPESIPLAWKEVPGASGYLIKIEKIEKDGVRRAFIEKQVDAASFKVPDTISSGRYLWSVTALKGSDKKPGVPAASRFQVQWVGILAAPELAKVKLEKDVQVRVPASQTMAAPNALGVPSVTQAQSATRAVPAKQDVGSAGQGQVRMEEDLPVGRPVRGGRR